MEIIAIDLGSNTLRVIARDCETGLFTHAYEKMVKTADTLVKTGRISDEAVERIVSALSEANEIFDFNNNRVVAMTTAAMRIAANSESAIESIYDRTGVRFEIIDAEREAYLTNLAVAKSMNSLGLGSEAFLLLDIGGGSTEIIYSCKDEIISRSLDVGIVTMSQLYETKETLVEAMYRAFEPLNEFKSSVADKPKASLLVATAGTATTMASLKLGMTVESYDAKRVNGTRISIDELEEGLVRLMAMEESARALHVGVGRDILIVAGVEILKVLLDILGFGSAVVIDDGLREGIAIEHCRAGADT